MLYSLVGICSGKKKKGMPPFPMTSYKYALLYFTHVNVCCWSSRNIAKPLTLFEILFLSFSSNRLRSIKNVVPSQKGRSFDYRKSISQWRNELFEVLLQHVREKFGKIKRVQCGPGRQAISTMETGWRPGKRVEVRSSAGRCFSGFQGEWWGGCGEGEWVGVEA